MKPTLAQICSLPSPFERDIEDYASGACHSMELWLGKLETYLHDHSPAEVRALLAQHEMAAPVAAFQGGLFETSPQASQEHWSLFRRRLPILAELGVSTLIVVGDFKDRVGPEQVPRISENLISAARLAGEHSLRLAFEFQGRASFANNLHSAVALIEQCEQQNLGLCLDLFHYHIGPSKPEDLSLLTVENLFHVQLCDTADVPREWASDADRILPGEGDIFLQPLLDRLHAIDYQGPVSIELMNPEVWQVPAVQFGEIAITALRKQLGQATMG